MKGPFDTILLINLGYAVNLRAKAHYNCIVI